MVAAAAAVTNRICDRRYSSDGKEVTAVVVVAVKVLAAVVKAFRWWRYSSWAIDDAGCGGCARSRRGGGGSGNSDGGDMVGVRNNHGGPLLCIVRIICAVHHGQYGCRSWVSGAFGVLTLARPPLLPRACPPSARRVSMFYVRAARDGLERALYGSAVQCPPSAKL